MIKTTWTGKTANTTAAAHLQPVSLYCEVSGRFVREELPGPQKVENARRMVAHILNELEMPDMRVCWFFPRNELPARAKALQTFQINPDRGGPGRLLGFFHSEQPDAIWLWAGADAETVARTAAHEMGHTFDFWFTAIGFDRDKLPPGFDEDFAEAFARRFYEQSDGWRTDDEAYLGYLSGKNFAARRDALLRKQLELELEAAIKRRSAEAQRRRVAASREREAGVDDWLLELPPDQRAAFVYIRDKERALRALRT